MKEISSKNNNKIKEIIKFRDDKKYRDSHSIYFTEGERNVADINADSIVEIFVKDTKINDFKYIYEKISGDNIYILSNDVFDKISSTVNAQGIACLSKYITNFDINDALCFKNIVVLDNINDPGNLGTIIRTCEAAGIDLLIISDDSCDIYNPKTLRACMSSLSRVNIRISHNLLSDLYELNNNHFNIYITLLDNHAKSIYDIDFNNKNCIVFGNEANGVKKTIAEKFMPLYIPMKGKIESLNVSSAVSVVCFEIMRQNLK